MRSPYITPFCLVFLLATPLAAEDIFEPGAKLKLEVGDGAGGEGPAWHPKLGILSSGADNHIHQLDRDGKSHIWRKDAGTNGLLFDRKGQLAACDSEGRRMVRIDPDSGKLTVLTDRFDGKRYNSPNDVTIDSQDRIYFSDPRYGPRDGMEIRDDKGRTIEGVYRIDPDGKVTRVMGREVERANGVLVSPDDRYLYVADNNNDNRDGARKLLRFDLKKDGSVDLASKKLLRDWGQGRGPDGVKQDSKGRLYVAAGLNKPNPPFEPAEDVKGGIYVLSPEGKLLTFLAVPKDEVTNCAFGGDDLRTLYITAGGTLYSIRTTTPGRVIWPAAKSAPNPAPKPERPKLAVLVVFDQFRGDYPKRWDELYGRGGLHRLEEDGAWFQDCHYAYANTVTGAGHASVATGASPQTHGIIANEWYDRVSKTAVNCVESERYKRVPPAIKKPADDTEKKKKEYTGVAPDRLLVPTLSDALKKATGGRAHVVSLSFKDRGAVLPGGQHPDACYWFDSTDGLFVTSTYYRDQVHSWIAKYNEDHPAERWFGKEWTRLRPKLDYEAYSGPDDAPGEGKGTAQGTTFPHPFDGGPKKSKSVYYKQLYNSPFGNEILLELAKRAIDGEELGHHDVPDLLCLSFSCNDPIGHVWGPDSQEVLDVTLRTDQIIKELLDTLDEKVGKGKYILVLTADHGVCPLPEAAKARGLDAGRTIATQLKSKANQFLVEKFGGDERTRYIADFIHPWFSLNQELLRAKELKQADVETALAEWLVKQPGIEKAYTRTQLIAGVAKDDAIGQAVRRSFHPDRAGEVVVVQKPYHIVYSLTGTTHGSPHSYDTHVPLFVYGPGVKPGARTELVRPQTAVPILARSLGIDPPTTAEESVPSGLFEK